MMDDMISVCAGSRFAVSHTKNPPMFRSVIKSVARNTSVLAGQQAITLASSFVVMLLLPKYVGPVLYGWLFVASSVKRIFTVFVEFGGSYLIAKKIARDPDQTSQVVMDSFGLRFVFGVLSFVATIIYAYTAGYGATFALIIIIYGTGLLWQGGITTMYSAYQGREVMRYTSYGAVAERVFHTVVVIVAVLVGMDIVFLAILLITGSLLNLIVLLLFSRNISFSLRSVNWRAAVRQIGEAVPYFLLAAFSTIYYRIDSIMLSHMCPDEVAGWYGGAYGLFDSLNFPYLLTIAVFPVLARLWKAESETHNRTLHKTLEITLITGIPAAVAAVLFARNIVSVFYGLQDYGQSVLLLQVLAGGLLFLYADMILGTALLAADKQWHQSIVAFLAIPLNIGLNLWLIPMFQEIMDNGAIGASIATTCTELVILISFISLLPRGVLAGFRTGVVLKGLLSGGIMAASILMIMQYPMPWPLAGVLGLGAYVGSLFVFKTFEPAEEEFLRTLLTVSGAGRAFRALFQRTPAR